MKKATLALAGLMAVTSAANASWARWNGFGAAAAFIADVQDIWSLPGVVASNPDAAYIEFQTNGTTTDDWGGAHLSLGPGVLGLWSNRPYTELSNINGGFTVPTAGNSASSSFLVPSTQIDVLYGFKVSDTLDLGIGVNRSLNTSKTETTTAAGTAVTSAESSDLGVAVGAEVKEVGPMALLEVGVTYNMATGTNTFKNAAGTVNDKLSSTGTDMDLRVGADIKGDGGSAQRIELGFNTDALDFKNEPGTAPAANTFIESKNSASAWNLGWAMSKSSDKGMGIWGLMLSSVGQGRNEANNTAFSPGIASVNKRDSSAMMLQLVAAGEAKANSWLTGRAGFQSNLYNTSSVTTETTVNVGGGTSKSVVTTSGGVAGTAAAATAGLSFTLGNLVIDSVFTQGLVATAGLGAFLGQVSATYAFGGSAD